MRDKGKDDRPKCLTTFAGRAICRLVADLVIGDYGAITANSRIGHITIDELKSAVLEYRRTLRPIPESALDDLDVYPLKDVPGAVAVDVPLWTEEEGRSDLTLAVTINEVEDGIRIEIDDLHVL